MPAATEQRMTVTDYKHAFAKVSQAYRNLKKSGQAEWEDLGQRGMVQLMSGVAGVSVGAARAFLGDATTGDIEVGGVDADIVAGLVLTIPSALGWFGKLSDPFNQLAGAMNAISLARETERFLRKK